MLIMIGLIVIAVLSLLLVAVFIYDGNINFIENMPQGFSTWNFVWAFLMGLFSFLTFSPIYFALEGDNLYLSIKKSIRFSLKNLDFIMILFLISASTFLVLSLFLDNYQNLWQLIIRSLIYQFETFLLTAASLIFYQNHKVKSA